MTEVQRKGVKEENEESWRKGKENKMNKKDVEIKDLIKRKATTK